MVWPANAFRLTLVEANAPFTFTAWVKTTDKAGPIFSQRSTASDLQIIALSIGYNGVTQSPGSVMALVRQDGAKGGNAQVVGGKINDGTWHHLALTRGASIDGSCVDVIGTVELNQVEIHHCHAGTGNNGIANVIVGGGGRHVFGGSHFSGPVRGGR